MGSSIWKGSLSFGLVNIPVELRTAVRAEHIHFRLLYKQDLTPVKYERFSTKGAGPLKWADIVKGYEYEKGKYVVLSEEDFRAAALGKSSAIELLDFVAQDAVDPRFFETPYYLIPSKGGEKGYALLREAIRRSAVVGIGKIVMRNTQHLVGVKASGDALVLEIMRFATELVDAGEYHFPAASTVRPQELRMAEQLVQNLAGDFDPSKYTDEYRGNLMRLVRARMQGKRPRRAVDAAPAGDDKVVDLMSRLQESLRAGKRRPAGRSRRATSTASQAATTHRARRTRKSA